MTRPPRQSIEHCGPHIISPLRVSHATTPQTEVQPLIGRGNTIHTITISHREARLCLLITQVLIPIFEAPPLSGIGLVIRSRLRGRRIPGSKLDSTENPPYAGLLHAKSYVGAKCPPAGAVWKFRK
ncbi:hypothetical protein AVEN_187489-1 [Araneus ventricosus]|uniref:Uncharacterized protein n=1 Tax=Araneus ventricosus TaxID=182803 RepID=A0A4Y2BTP0_ARAVE|nr:hypothetical protein AVEN_187489-1 [Araneus ventricosus]